MGKLSLAGEVWLFLRQNKKLWLLPIIVVLLLLGVLLIFAQSSALAPCSAFKSTKSPSTRQSISVRMKQVYASEGVQTIGSPRTLKLVLTRTAQPVRRSNAESSS